jgi:hypothetical protein
MNLEESMAGEDSESAGGCSELAGTNFMIKNMIPMKIPELKRSRILIIAEFCGIPTRFSNQDLIHWWK